MAKHQARRTRANRKWDEPSAIETNLRIVKNGPNLWVATRRVQVQGALAGLTLSSELLEKACNSIVYRHGRAAVRLPDKEAALAVASQSPLPPLPFEAENRAMAVTDADEPRVLSLVHQGAGRDGEARLIEILLQRALLIEVGRRTSRWTLKSPRKWYANEPFDIQDGIRAHRCVALASLFVEGVGIGIAADIQTAFLTDESILWFIDPHVSGIERQRRRERLEELTARQQGRYGTLVYDDGVQPRMCWLKTMPEGLTCGQAPVNEIKGQKYDSLHDYYRRKAPHLNIEEDEPAVYVSFDGLPMPVPVAACRLWARVGNEQLPRALNNCDKIAPGQRRRLIEEFWKEIGPRPFGRIAPDLEPGFWRPDEDRVWRIQPPALQFANGTVLPSPDSPAGLRKYYEERLSLLENGGCFDLPATTSRTLRYAFPTRMKAAAKRMADDVCAYLGKCARVTFTPQPVEYSSVEEGIAKMKRLRDSGVALWVLDSSPSSYYEVELQLQDWRPKRVTESTLQRKWNDLQKGKYIPRDKTFSQSAGRRSWDQFVVMVALDVLQKMDAIPYRISQAGPYEAMLVIDLNNDGRFFALSLMITREPGKTPNFLLETVVHQKNDNKETLNARILEDEITAFVEETLCDVTGRCTPLQSLLILRDGRWCSDEINAVHRSLQKLMERGRLISDARADLAEFYKNSAKELRLWEVGRGNEVRNVPEGTGVEIHETMAVLATTGAATLSQGTAEPIIITGTTRFPIEDAVYACESGSQLNWSSPRVAQRLALPFKRADEELEARSQQEVRRIK